jgi:type I restriction enzyme S subunit
VQAGDILLARSGATVGKAFLVTTGAGEACHAGYLIRARPRREVIVPEFLFAFTQSTGFIGWKDSTFIIATIQNIGAGKYAGLPVPLPPIREQSAIVRFLQKDTDTILAAIDRAQREISLLREYRTRLIADVVTGKLDVREAAAKLPEEVEEPTSLEDMDAVEDEDTIDEVETEPTIDKEDS